MSRLLSKCNCCDPEIVSDTETALQHYMSMLGKYNGASYDPVIVNTHEEQKEIIKNAALRAPICIRTVELCDGMTLDNEDLKKGNYKLASVTYQDLEPGEVPDLEKTLGVCHISDISRLIQPPKYTPLKRGSHKYIRTNIVSEDLLSIAIANARNQVDVANKREETVLSQSRDFNGNPHINSYLEQYHEQKLEELKKQYQEFGLSVVKA